MKKQQVGTIAVIVLIIAAVIVVAGGGAYYYFSPRAPSTDEQIFCTQEAKQCPDGSYVSRTGPQCEFAPCPNPATTSTSHIPDDWKTYRNEKYGFEFKYPNNLFIAEDASGQNNVIFDVSVRTYKANGRENGHGAIPSFLSVSIFDNKGLSIKKCEAAWMDEGTIIISSEQARKCSFENAATGKEIYFIAVHNNYEYVIYSLESNLALNKVISTFKFIK